MNKIHNTLLKSSLFFLQFSTHDMKLRLIQMP